MLKSHIWMFQLSSTYQSHFSRFPATEVWRQSHQLNQLNGSLSHSMNRMYFGFDYYMLDYHDICWNSMSSNWLPNGMIQVIQRISSELHFTNFNVILYTNKWLRFIWKKYLLKYKISNYILEIASKEWGWEKRKKLHIEGNLMWQ